MHLQEHCCQLMSAVAVAADTLSLNQYANYVVQRVVEYGSADLLEQVSAAFTKQGSIGVFSQNRMASNVVEKLFNHGSPDVQNALSESVLAQDGQIVEMACNQFGSFVVQRMLEVLRDTPWEALCNQQLRCGRQRLSSSKHWQHWQKYLDAVDKDKADGISGTGSSSGPGGAQRSEFPVPKARARHMYPASVKQWPQQKHLGARG